MGFIGVEKVTQLFVELFYYHQIRIYYFYQRLYKLL